MTTQTSAAPVSPQAQVNLSQEARRGPPKPGCASSAGRQLIVSVYIGVTSDRPLDDRELVRLYRGAQA